MQFIANGPDIPEALLDAHEEGRVIFFCGAGISYPAGLPGFRGLVNAIYERLGTYFTPIEREVYERGQFDSTLDLLERRFPGQRQAVRKALLQVLNPKLKPKGAIDTHAALLQLARNREGVLRLVTTNFDRVFEVVAHRLRQPLESYLAPMLPIPKQSRWNGLVYLHGLLPEKEDESALNRLVLTSGDFGLAYLIERWAARFVSELFRNYVVCFVGYSINDPVLRYMMDALAADRMLGEVGSQAYALGDCKPREESRKNLEWEAKNVVPILYEVPDGTQNHSALYRTLKVWAETYRDGIHGKERIVMDYAFARPSASTRQDDFVGRMLWALSHPSGLPAKRFAEFNPAPSLEWLEEFSTDRYGHADLRHFNVPPCAVIDDNLAFSIVHRPAPYALAPRMCFVSGDITNVGWDNVMSQLGRWLLRHLNDRDLILWFAKSGGQLHERWSWLLEGELDRFSRLEKAGKDAELAEIRANAPNAIPSPIMRKLWRLLLTGRLKSGRCAMELYSWKDQLKRDGLTATLRFELRELLSPKVSLRKPFPWSNKDDEGGTPECLRKYVDWEMSLAADEVHSSLKDLATDDIWLDALPQLFDYFQQLLRDVLDLMAELGEADERNDRSCWDLPSITPHWQNRGFPDWVVLIELVRDSWLEVFKLDPARASLVAQGWFALPYPTFKRLALFAASRDGCIAPEKWVEWLTEDNAWWLWSPETRRETMRLLVLQGTRLSLEAEAKLEATILFGPPRMMYRDDLDPVRWQSIKDRSVWLLLAKLRESGSSLKVDAQERFTALSEANPYWKLANHERDEFSRWMSGTGDPDFEGSRKIEIAPRKRKDLVDWLRRPGEERRDTWRETCKKHFANAGFALADLAKEGKWFPERWQDALYVWSEKKRAKRSWQCFAPLLQTIPDEILKKITDAVSFWLEAVSTSTELHEAILLELCHRILAMQSEAHNEAVDSDRPVTQAINHPVGHVTQTVLNVWFKRGLNDNEGLPNDIGPLFTRMCDTQVEQFRHARVLLAANIIPLFRVDRGWVEKHMLPLFDWSTNPIEAKAAWCGFLSSPRLYRPLLIAFKNQFLDTVQHYEELGEDSRQFTAFLTFSALEPIDGYSKGDFQSAFAKLPQEGLREAARVLRQALEAAGEQGEEYWKNRVQPFWQQIWPKSRDFLSKEIAETLARLAIAAKEEFPAALFLVKDWLQPINHPHHVIHLLHETGLDGRFPEDALLLLDQIINDQPWISTELKECLGVISKSSHSLVTDPRFQRLELKVS
jgi:hypothetical protein